MQLFKLESELDMKNDELTELYTEAFKFHQANKNIKKNKKDVIGNTIITTPIITSITGVVIIMLSGVVTTLPLILSSMITILLNYLDYLNKTKEARESLDRIDFAENQAEIKKLEGKIHDLKKMINFVQSKGETIKFPDEEVITKNKVLTKKMK